MEKLVKQGKDRTILISVCILLVSLHTIYFYQSSRVEIDTPKLFQQGVRFLLTIGLLYATYIGKRWARILSIILYTIGVIQGIFYSVIIDAPIINKLPLIEMTVVFFFAVYHFGFSESYKSFFKYQNSINNG